MLAGDGHDLRAWPGCLARSVEACKVRLAGLTPANGEAEGQGEKSGDEAGGVC